MTPASTIPGSSRSVIVGIGELLWDCFGDDRRPGGAPANVAFHADLLGARGLVVSRVGTDALSDALIAHLRDHGMDTRYVQRDDAHPTGTVTVAMRRPNEPAYTIHENVAWDHIELIAEIMDVARRADVVCFGTLAQRSARSRATILGVLERVERGHVLYDVNLRQPWYSRDVIEQSLHRCTVMKLNGDEVGVVADLLEFPCDEDAFTTAVRDRFDVDTVCITHGDDGCSVTHGNTRVEVPGRAVEVADAVGAGDAFSAAFACGLAWGWSVEATARLANEVGALVASRPGAMPDLRDEYRRMVERLRS